MLFLLSVGGCRGGQAAIVPLFKHFASPLVVGGVTKALFFSSSMCENDDNNSNNNNNKTEYFTIGLTGSGGCIGTAFRDELMQRGWRTASGGGGGIHGKPIRLVCLIRSDQTEDWSNNINNNNENENHHNNSGYKEMQVKWNPKGQTAEEILHPNVADGLDAIVHLSGENIATGLGTFGFLGLRPWTEAKKKEILDSRTVTSAALAKVVAASPTHKSFLCASGIGAYGNHFIGDAYDAVDESADTSQSRDFLAQVSRQWEEATKEASSDGRPHRVVNMRFGVVLSKFGGALEKLYPIFWLGGGGRVGSGQQYFPFISARDLARAMIHTLETPRLSGPVNFCAPETCTNHEFTEALGQCLGRPTLLPFPAFAVRMLFGEMGQEMLLGGVRAKPTKLLQSGFEFQHPTIQQAIGSAMEESI